MARPPSPDAFWFGPPERRAFGWYHAPVGGPRDMAVVLCPPLGHEMLCTHRAYRHLAQQLSTRGFPVLRFDYHGTGDSAGSDHDGNRVPDWLATIDEAIELIRQGGATRVTLFGIRIGATFATTVALRRTDVDALALVAPAVSGATYLRELRAMHRLRDRGELRPPFQGQRDGDEEAIGFVFRRETVAALSRIDSRTIETTRPLPVVIVPRDDLPGAEAKIAARFKALGSPVDVIEAGGYSALAADDPYVADVPHAILGRSHALGGQRRKSRRDLTKADEARLEHDRDPRCRRARDALRRERAALRRALRAGFIERLGPRCRHHEHWGQLSRRTEPLGRDSGATTGRERPRGAENGRRRHWRQRRRRRNERE